MKRAKSNILMVAWTFLTMALAHAQQPESSHEDISTPRPQVSLITCGSGDAIHTLFGHSALRINNETTGTDIVFNYGIFSFKTPHFVWRFTLGQTDYQLGAQYFNDFMTDYVYANREVTEQVLNLTPAQTDKLIGLLNENYRPENRFYRYNYFYDNCATRPRDIIEKTLGDRLRYGDAMDEPDAEGSSFRDLIHAYSNDHQWEQLGIDLCLGLEADQPISRHMSMFIPFYLSYYMGGASVIAEDGQEMPLVTQQNVLWAADEEIDEEGAAASYIPSPRLTFALLFVIIALATIYGIRRKRSLWVLDLVLFAAAGIGGALLTFLSICSEHPAVGYNLTIVILHPLYLILLPWLVIRIRQQRRSRFLVLNAVVIVLFIIGWPFLPQEINLAVLPLALSLLVRSLSNILLSSSAHSKK